MPTLKEIEACQDYIGENSFVDQKTGCWIWQKFKDKNGRGYGRSAGFKDRLVQRMAWAAFEGGGRPYPGSIKMNCANNSCCFTGHMPRPKTRIKLQNNRPLNTATPPAEISATRVIIRYEATKTTEPTVENDEPGLTWEEVFAAFFLQSTKLGAEK